MRNAAPSENATSSTRDWPCTVIDWGVGEPAFRPAMGKYLSKNCRNQAPLSHCGAAVVACMSLPSGWPPPGAPPCNDHALSEIPRGLVPDSAGRHRQRRLPRSRTAATPGHHPGLPGQRRAAGAPDPGSGAGLPALARGPQQATGTAHRGSLAAADALFRVWFWTPAGKALARAAGGLYLPGWQPLAAGVAGDRVRAADRSAPAGHITVLKSLFKAASGRPPGQCVAQALVQQGQARDHMPVQVRHHVTERSEVDLGGQDVLAQHLLHHGDGIHAMQARAGVKVGELCHMGIPDHPVERRKARLVGTDHAQLLAAPDQMATVGVAQRAGCRHTRTRSIPPWLARCTYSGSQFSPRICLAISITM